MRVREDAHAVQTSTVHKIFQNLGLLGEIMTAGAEEKCQDFSNAKIKQSLASPGIQAWHHSNRLVLPYPTENLVKNYHSNVSVEFPPSLGILLRGLISVAV
jgi:hypothetical protein